MVSHAGPFFKGVYMIDLFNLSTNEADLLNALHVPATYYKKDSLAYQYWFRSLLHKIDSSIIFKNLPKGWSNDFLMFNLWVRGYVAVFKTNIKELFKYGENGVLFTPCFCSGMDFYYQPTDCAVINNIYQPKNNFIIHKDCEILKLCPDCFWSYGVLSILDYYASKLAEMSKSIDMSIEASKLSVILTAENEAQSQTLKAVWDKVQKGESLVIYNDVNMGDELIPRKEPFTAWTQEMAKNYILTSQLADMQTILNQFYCEIGLPVAVEKKERLVTSEADFAAAQSQARIACWANTLRESLELINTKYGTDIQIEIAREENERDVGEINPDRNRE